MASLQPGDIFGERYEITGVLGRGGFGVVYAANDRVVGRDVAIKLLTADPERGYDASTRARFEREVRIIASLRSPHTVVMHDCGENEHGLFMVCEYLPGEDLSELLARQGRLDAQVVVHILRQLLGSVREAHDAGLLHRDIKPANIRVMQHGDDPYFVKLLDFGLARSANSSRPSITATGELVGTPRYMSPEQLTEAPLAAASDIYSLGVVAFEMLLGPEMLQGNRWGDQFERLQSGHVFSIPETERIGPQLIAVIERMTARDPEARYPSAAAVLAALDRLDAQEQPRPSAIAPSAPSPHRRRMFAFVVLLVVAALGAALVVVLTPTPEPRDTEQGVAILPPNFAPRPAQRTAPPADRDAEPETAGAIAYPSYASRGCGADPPFTGADNLTSRTAIDEGVLTYVPEKYDRDRPHSVVILVHPLGFPPRDFLRITGFAALADRENFVIAVPDWKPPMLGPLENAEAVRRAIDEIERSVRLLGARLCIDARRVFLIGQNEGGRSTWELSCAPWVTAVASSSFLPDAATPVCAPSLAKPALMLVGRNDGHVPFEGGTSCSRRYKRSVAEVEAIWRDRNGCVEKPAKTTPYGASACHTYTCDVPFRSCHLEGGHNWPGSPGRGFLDPRGCDGEPADFPSAEVVWEFFADIEPLDVEQAYDLR